MTVSRRDSWRSRLEAIFPTLSQAATEDTSPHSFEAEPVLVVDDDEDWANECAFTLRTLGYDPLIARNADEAVARFLSRPISIAIVDYNIPGRDGISLSYELTQAAEADGRKLHFIMATGYATKDLAIGAMRASAADFLEKPIRQADLRKALQRIEGLSDTPTTRELLINSITGLRSELNRLAQLMDDPDRTVPPDDRSPVRSETGALASPEDPGESGLDASALAEYIRELLKKESKRRSIGESEVFGDPAWEMLLDLMLAKMEGRRVSISSACIASGAPMSTALRLVGRLVDEGVLRKLPDKTDRRRHFLILDTHFEQPFLEYLSEQLHKSGSGV